MKSELKIIISIALITLIILVGGIFVLEGFKKQNQEDIVVKDGIHWHPRVLIFIKGEKQELESDIGRKGEELPIHTHDEDYKEGVIHLEFPGTVKKDDIRLGRFFEIWGKRFSRDCLFEFCNNENSQVRMKVNGQENNEFENYVMRDGDQIEIRYE